MVFVVSILPKAGTRFLQGFDMFVIEFGEGFVRQWQWISENEKVVHPQSRVAMSGLFVLESVEYHVHYLG